MATTRSLPLFRRAARGHSTGIRHLVVGDYLTLYRVGADAVEIVRVLHGRRKIEVDDLNP
ncbi:type II toxin-antitoxin system RelE/ParE family toxin [Mesorhizobium sp. M8A.F.Ca.ET.182.01.1.1]|uniref:type II toxin-antitoxin system RelE/ParE family toxin n=1 Tax=Mesorhizobium sp. M8A.F.Ca.ET.181.01.1.1 TaxID=2563963 RepID=UPI003004A59B